MASFLTTQALVPGDKFPDVLGKSLSGRKISLPHDVQGKISILVVYFYQEARPQVQEWHNLLLKKYGKCDDLICIEMLMVRDYAYLYSFILDRKLKRIIPRRRHENVLLYYGKLERYYYYFDVNNLADCYVFMLDKKGKVCLSDFGSVTQEKTDKIAIKLEELADQRQFTP